MNIVAGVRYCSDVITVTLDSTKFISSLLAQFVTNNIWELFHGLFLEDLLGGLDH